MKTGILGGVFDPPHSGHLHMAESALKYIDLEEVLFIPCNRQPMKGRRPVASPIERASMTALATAMHPGFKVEHAELERGGISYTIDTMEELAKRRPDDDLYLIIGTDNLLSFRLWKRYSDILELAELVVIPRETGKGAVAKGAKDVEHLSLNCPELSVSSTLVRELVCEKKPIGGLVSPLVEDYIKKRGLYSRRKAIES